MKDVKVMVPAPVLAEYLVGATATELHEMAVFEMGFQVPPFDAPAAKITAELPRDTDLIKTIKKEQRVGHQCVKTDAMIIAIAISRSADRIVTSDNDFLVLERLAKGKISISRIPEIPANIDE
jgi:predicted nucleic acid-binding protein